MLLTLKNVLDIEGTFLVPRYQRGYRWTDTEVKALLNDLKQNGKNKRYCLQPVVVKKMSDGRYELIDGQQRLTTIYILLNVLKRFFPMMEIKYTIDYDTRSDTKSFLDNINEEDAEKYIDFHFIHLAYQTIIAWMKEQGDAMKTAQKLYGILINDAEEGEKNTGVDVIWYEADDNVASQDLFTRLNIGRIPLTNAELVRALFLNRGNAVGETSKEIEKDQEEIAYQWDSMEKDLRDNKYWGFLTNEKYDDYDTHLDLIFNIMAKDSYNPRERYATFLHFSNLIVDKGQDKEEVWVSILQFSMRMKEWYTNKHLYHKIGYLVAVGEDDIKHLLDVSEGMDKDKFMSYLNGEIAKSIKTDKDYDDLQYDTDYEEIVRLLLLFNVETMDKIPDDSVRFDFSKYKNDEWSLEHIHAQQTQGLNTQEKQKACLKEHLIVLNDWRKEKEQLPQDVDIDQLVEDIEEVVKEDAKLTEIRFSNLYNRIVSVMSPKENVEYIHQLSNMALLKSKDNSALNNSTFDVKRRKIIEFHLNGEYIPLCTLRVFMKYYNKSTKLFYWEKADRDEYMKDFKETLKPYISLYNEQTD